MKESRIMLIQYSTAVAALFLVGFHLLLQGVLIPYSTAISYRHVLSLYQSAVDGSLLEILLVVILVHGFNGLRIILLELRQGGGWTKLVNFGIIIPATAIAIAYGTRTILLVATAAH